MHVQGGEGRGGRAGRGAGWCGEARACREGMGEGGVMLVCLMGGQGAGRCAGKLVCARGWGAAGLVTSWCVLGGAEGGGRGGCWCVSWAAGRCSCKLGGAWGGRLTDEDPHVHAGGAGCSKPGGAGGLAEALC